MKYLVLIAVIVLVLWHLRTNSRASSSASASGAARKGAAPGGPQEMIECPVCKVHLPRTDALAGPDGRLYCCAEHRERSS
jgi:uncharacterized protein